MGNRLQLFFKLCRLSFVCCSPFLAVHAQNWVRQPSQNVRHPFLDFAAPALLLCSANGRRDALENYTIVFADSKNTHTLNGHRFGRQGDTRQRSNGQIDREDSSAMPFCAVLRSLSLFAAALMRDFVYGIGRMHSVLRAFTTNETEKDAQQPEERNQRAIDQFAQIVR
jgi:hypothetical protein